MGLMVPRWGFQYCWESYDDYIPDDIPSQLITLGNSNAMSGVTQISTGALLADIQYLVITIAVGNSTGVATANMMDVMYDPAGGTSWTTLIPSLLCGYGTLPIGGSTVTIFRYQVPIWVPSGSTIGVRAQTERTSGTHSITVGMWGFGEPSRPDMWWCGTKVDALGVNTSTSRGTSVTPGESNVFGTAVSFTATNPYGALLWGVPGAADTSTDAKAYLLRMKTSSGATVGWPGMTQIVRTFDATEAGVVDNQFGPNWVEMVGNETIYVDAACNTTVPETLNLGLYGVY